MRDPARIPEILNSIKAIWERNPDLRLGQLLGNAIDGYKLYYMEDDELIKALKDYTNKLPKEHADDYVPETATIELTKSKCTISRKYKAIIHHPDIYDMRGQDTVGIKQRAYDEECEIKLFEEQPLKEIELPKVVWTDYVSTTGTNTSCESCSWYNTYIAAGKTYVGDCPCNWCDKSPIKVTC